MKMNNKGSLSFGMAMIVVTVALLSGGEYQRQQGQWGVKDGVKGKQYIEPSPSWYEDTDYKTGLLLINH